MRNTTKVLSHLAKIPGESIVLCDHNLSKPSEDKQAAYTHRAKAFCAGQNFRAFKSDTIDSRLRDRHEAVIRAADERKHKSVVKPFHMFSEDTDGMPGLVSRAGYVPRASPTDSIMSHTTNGFHKREEEKRGLSFGRMGCI